MKKAILTVNSNFAVVQNTPEAICTDFQSL